LGRYKRTRFSEGKITYIDKIVKNEENTFNSIYLIVENTNFTPEYLRSIYVIEFYRILRKVEQKIKSNK